MSGAVFLDRDGTIITDKAYLSDSGHIVLEKNAVEGIKAFNSLGMEVIIVTNQPHVARGFLTEEDVVKINTEVIRMLTEKGAKVAAAYYCPHHPEQHKDVPEHAEKYRIVCECRKPGAGMLKQAAVDHAIDLEESFMIGDRTMDILAGKNAGCTTVLVKTGSGGADGKHDVKADYEAADLLEASKVVRNSKICVVVLAGGKGERLMPLTRDIPKPMILIANTPAVQHHIELAKRHGFSHVVICASHMSGRITSYFGRDWNGVRISYPPEPAPLGSGGAIKNAAPFVDSDNFIVLNGDVMTDIDMTELLDFHLKNGGIATMVVRRTDHPKDSDVVIISGDRIVKYVGRGQEKETMGNAGLMVLNKRVLSFIPDVFCSIEDVIFKLIGKEDVYGYMSGAYIKDFGTPERLESVRKRFA